MKSKQIRKIRKIINTPDYYFKRYLSLLNKLGDLQIFYHTECSDYNKGFIVAEYNRKVYNAIVPRLEKKIKWYEKHIDFTKSKLYKNNIQY